MKVAIAAGRDGVLDEDGDAGGVAAPRAERAAGEGVAAAGGRQRRAELGQAEDHRAVHHGHEHGGDEQPAETAFGQAEVPPGVVAGDDGGDAEPGEQHPAGGAGPQLALGEVAGVDVLGVDAAPQVVRRPSAAAPSSARSSARSSWRPLGWAPATREGPTSRRWGRRSTAGGHAAVKTVLPAVRRGCARACRRRAPRRRAAHRRPGAAGGPAR